MDYSQMCLDRALNGVQCSGHGSCVKDIGCKCDFGWTGSSDLIDFYRIDCQLSKIADTVLWAIVVILFLLLWRDYYRSIVIVKAKYTELSDRQLEKRGVRINPWTYKPFLALLPGFFILCPMYIAIGCIRIASDRVVGTDILMTVLTVLSTITMFITNFFMQTHIVQSLVIHLSSDARFQALVALHDKLYLLATVFVIFLTVIPQIAVLFFPPFNGDAQHSPAFVILIMKNIGTILYVFLLGLTAVIMENRVKHLTAQTVSPSNSKISKILEGFAAISKDSKKKVVVSVIIYVIFTTPPLWGMQNYIYAIIYIVYSAGGATTGRYYLKARAGEGSKPSHSNKTGTTEEKSLGSAAVVAVAPTVTDLQSHQNRDDDNIQTRTEQEFTTTSFRNINDPISLRGSTRFSDAGIPASP